MDLLDQILATGGTPPVPPRARTASEILDEIISGGPKSAVEDVVKTPREPGKPVYTKGRKLDIPDVDTEKVTKDLPVEIRDGNAAFALSKGMLASFAKGVLTPVGMFLPRTFGALSEVQKGSHEQFRTWLDRPDITQTSVGPMSDRTKSFVATAPEVTAEIAGSFVPGLGIGATVNKVTKGARAITKVLASSGANASFSAFAPIADGESRYARIAMDATIGAVAELAFLPLHAKAVAEEAPKLAKSLAARVAVERTAEMRAGLSRNVDAALEVMRTAQEVGEEHTPIAIQAAKIVEASERALPKAWTIETTLPDRYGVRLDLRVGDQDVPYLLPTDPVGSFEGALRRLDQIEDTAKQKGQSFEILGAYAKHRGALSRFENDRMGRTGRPVNIPPTDSSPTGSLAETGQTVAVGARLRTSQGTVVEVVDSSVDRRQGTAAKTLDSEGTQLLRRSADRALANTSEERMDALTRKFGGQRVATHHDPELSAFYDRTVAGTASAFETPPTHLRVKHTATGREEVLPKAKLFVMTPGAREPFTPSPHPDGSPRRFVVDMTSGEVQFEPHGNLGSKFWRGPLFESVDHESDFAHTAVRGQVYKDGSVALSAAPLEFFTLEEGIPYRTSTYTKPHVEFGPLDVVEASRSKKPLYRGDPSQKSAAGSPFVEEQTGGTRLSTREVDQELSLARHQRAAVSEGPAERLSSLRKEYRHARQRGASQQELDAIKNRAFYPKSQLRRERMQGGSVTLGMYPAGSMPRTQQDMRWNKYTREWEANPVRVVERTGQYVSDEPEFLTDVRRIKKGGTREEGSAIMDRGFVARDEQRTPLPDVHVTPDMSRHPETALIRDAARMMIKRGWSESTPVYASVNRVRTEFGRGIRTTLGDFAKADIHDIPLNTLRQEAQQKGWKVYGQIGKVRLTDFQGQSKEFKTTTEALAFLGRTPVTRSVTKIEDQAEAALNMGRHRSWDADVDLKRFLPKEASDVAMGELVGGRRPLVTMYIKPSEVSTPAVEKGMANLPALEGVLRQVERQAGLRVGTFSTLQLAAEGDRTLVAVYDRTAVQRVIAQNAEPLMRLGVNPLEGQGIWKNPQLVMSELHAKAPDAIDMFKGRDPADALTYAWFRKQGMREQYLSGKLEQDSQGPFRTFTPEKRQLFGAPCQ